MEDLPNILIRRTALSLPFAEITSLCLTNTKFNKAICEYQQFWHDKLVLDYGITEKFSETLDWKKIYIHHKYRLIGVGSNEHGQLGLGQIASVNEFTEIPTVAVKDIACGFHHTVIIDVDGNLWGTGNDGVSMRNDNKFFKLTHGPKFIQIACGHDYTIALSNDNRIWVNGTNSVGQIGLSIRTHAYKFTELRGYQAKQIACGGSHSAFIDLDGKLYTFGHRHQYKLGRDGRYGYEIVPGEVSIPNPVIQVSCGADHTACIDRYNNIWVFGNNHYGQLGI